MTDFARRRQVSPPGSIKHIGVSRARVATVGALIERANPLSRMRQFPEASRQLLEAAQRKLFAHRQHATADYYDAPRSEIAAFLVSCRRIFWGLATFSGLSNILMLTGSFFMLQVYDRSQRIVLKKTRPEINRKADRGAGVEGKALSARARAYSLSTQASALITTRDKWSQI
jgi:hypothetical protein